MNEPLLRAEAVIKRFGKGRTQLTAVDGVSLELRDGAALALVGESGCGKTTLGRILAGLDRPDAGKVTYRGRTLASLSGPAWREFRCGVQFVFQDPVAALNPRKTARRALRDAAGHNRRVEAVAEQVGLGPGLLDRFPHELSGGQAQRVVIARAVAMDPALLILDEPVSALDVSVQAQLLRLLQELRGDLGLAYLLISHDLAVVEQLCEQVAVMRAGVIVETGTCGELFRAPRHEYTRALIDAVPVPGVVPHRA